MSATKLKFVLIGIIVLLLGAFGVGSWFLQQQLALTVQQTDHAKIEADIAAAELQQLRQLQAQFEDRKDIVDRAKQIAASADQYKYQDQVVSDISQYAKRYNMQITSFDFSTESAAKVIPTAGAKKTPFTITLKGPLPYKDFLRFIRDIEQNLTKIQVTSLTLSPDKNPSNVTNPTLNLEVYLKS